MRLCEKVGCQIGNAHAFQQIDHSEKDSAGTFSRYCEFISGQFHDIAALFDGRNFFFCQKSALLSRSSDEDSICSVIRFHYGFLYGDEFSASPEQGEPEHLSRFPVIIAVCRIARRPVDRLAFFAVQIQFPARF